MRKSVLSIMLLFAISMAASAQKFALIDTEYILKNIPKSQPKQYPIFFISSAPSSKRRNRVLKYHQFQVLQIKSKTFFQNYSQSLNAEYLNNRHD